jgi:hypothetical protein
MLAGLSLVFSGGLSLVFSGGLSLAVSLGFSLAFYATTGAGIPMRVRLPEAMPEPAAGIPSGRVEAVSRVVAFDDWCACCAGGLLAGRGGELDDGRGGVLAGFGGSLGGFGDSLGGLLFDSTVFAGSAGFGCGPGTSSHASSTESFSSLISGEPS